MKNALLIVTLSTLLAPGAYAQVQSLAPNTMQDKSIQLAQNVVPPLTATSQVADKADDPASQPLPSAQLTDELLFKLMRAELANQRGDWQLAYVTMMVEAQKTRDPRLAQRASEIALGARRTGEAMAAVRLWRQLAPNSDEANQFYLGLMVLGDNPAEVKPLLVQRLRDVSPQTRGLLILQIQRLLTRMKDKDAAFALLDELLAPYPELVETHLALAQGAFADNNIARARTEAQKALDIKPDLEVAILMLAQSMPDRAATLQTLATFLRTYPKAREVRIAYTKLLIDDKQNDAARKQFDILLKEQPNDLTILYAMGLFGAQNDDRATAEKYLTKYLQVLAQNPDDERDSVQPLLILAQIAADRKDYPAALNWLAQIEPGPAYLEAQVRSAQIMGLAGDVDGALNLLSHLKPEATREQIMLIGAEGQILRDANRLPAALDVLGKGLARFPDDTGLLYDYAMVAEKEDKIDLMEPALRKIIRLAPDNQNAYNALGYSFADRNIHLEEAYALIEKALAMAPDDPFILDSMGWVHFRLGHLQEAEDFLRRAYGIRADVEIGVHLGEVLWVKGEKDAAQKLWRDANKKDPQNDLLKSTLTRLRIRL